MGEPIALAGRLCPEIFSAVPHESKSVPQRLKPSSAQTITARLNPCPSFEGLFPSLSGAVQNWPTEKSNSDRCEVQPSPFDKLPRQAGAGRAGSAGLICIW